MADRPPAIVSRCVIAYTGMLATIKVLPSPPSVNSPGRVDNGSGDLSRHLSPMAQSSTSTVLTVKDFCTSASRQLFGVLTTVNVIAWPSQTALPEHTPIDAFIDPDPDMGRPASREGSSPQAAGGVGTEDTHLFLFFDGKLLPKVQAEVLTSASAIREVIGRQQAAARMMLSPLKSYFTGMVADQQLVETELTVTESELNRISAEIPGQLQELAKTTLVEDPSKTLADMVDIGKRVQLAGDMIAKVRSSTAQRVRGPLRELKEELERVEGRQDPLSARLGPDENDVVELQQRTKRFTVLVDVRMKEAKHYLRSVVDVRNGIKKDRQTLKSVKSGVLEKLPILTDLATVYEKAVEIAKDRHTFYTAVRRVHNVLGTRAAELQQDVEDFKAEYGRRFPSNLCPGIALPVTAGALPQDPLAVAMDANYTDLDDSASELLERLGLAGTGQPHSARAPRGAKASLTAGPEGEEAELRRQIANFKAELAERTAELELANEEIAKRKVEVEDQRLLAEHATEQRDQQIRDSMLMKADLDESEVVFAQLRADRKNDAEKHEAALQILIRQLGEKDDTIRGLHDILKSEGRPVPTPRGVGASSPPAGAAAPASSFPAADVPQTQVQQQDLLNRRAAVAELVTGNVYPFLCVATGVFVHHHLASATTLIIRQGTSGTQKGLLFPGATVGGLVFGSVIMVEDAELSTSAMSSGSFALHTASPADAAGTGIAYVTVERVQPSV